MYSIIAIPQSSTLTWRGNRVLSMDEIEIFNHFLYLKQFNSLQTNDSSNELRGAFNKFPDFFVQAFTIVVDS